MKKGIQLYLAFILFTMSLRASAQQLPGNLGQPVNTSYDEINPVISPDGKLLFFTRVNHPENTFGEHDSEDIWFSELQTDGSWSVPARIANLNIGQYNAVLSISADGNTILLNGVYNKRGNIWKKRGVSVSTKVDGGWSTPEPLKISSLAKSNNGLKSSGSMSADGNFLVLSYSTAYNGERSDVFIAKRKNNGNWRRPKKVKKINSRASEDTPFLSADNNTLYFSSDRKTRNVFDIYKSVRKNESDKWSAPVLLSDTINSQAWDSYFKTNNKGTIAYFSSTRQLVNGADIYSVTIVEENPVVIVSGQIKSATDHNSITNTKFSITVNGSIVDSVSINVDSASYSLSLPLGKRYVLSAALTEFTSIPDTIDVTNVKSFTKLNNDLFVTPINVLVKGKILTKGGRKVIPAKALKGVNVNGAPSVSVKIDTLQMTYEISLRRGQSYALQIIADGFTSSSASVDLSDIGAAQAVALDLYVEPQKVVQKVEPPVEVDAVKLAPVTTSVMVTGFVINKKTNLAFAGNATFKVSAEGSAITPALDRETGKYQIQLAAGRSYAISASAPGYYAISETIDLTQAPAENMSRDLYLVPIEVGQAIRLNNIFFESGKAKLKKESFPELERVVGFMEDNADLKIEISGHTDNVGEAGTNQRLSLARAQAVASYLVSKGIRSSRIVSRGYGFERPVTSNNTPEGRSQNRRVEFTILSR